MSRTQSLTRHWLRDNLWKVVVAIVILYFLIWPMVMLAFGTVRTTPFGVEGKWTLAGFARVFTDPWTPKAVLASTLYSTVATFGCMSLGLHFVVVTTRMDTRLRWIVGPAMIMLLATPRLFYAMSWAMLGNPNSGLMASTARFIGIERLPEWATVYSWPGLIGVTALKLTAFAYLLLYGPATRIDRNMEDAAVMAGVSRPRAFFTITATSLAPALLATGMFIFVENFRLFDVPAVIGLPAGIHTLPIRVNDYLLENVRANWSAASALSMVVVIIVAALIYVQTAILKGRDFTTIGGKAIPANPVPIGRWSYFVDASIVLFIAVAIVLPLVQIVLGSFQPFFGLYGTYTLDNYRFAFGENISWIMVVTFLIAISGGFIAVASAFGLALLMQRRPGTFIARLARLGSWVPVFAPGIVLSLALLWAYLNTPFMARLYGTPWLMLFALIVGSIPVATRTVEGIVAQVGPEVEEAARTCGANSVSAIVRITVPLCAPSLLAAWLIVGLGISGTLDIPLLFQSIKAHTIATMAFYLFNYGQVTQAAALFITYLVSVLIAVGTVVLVGWLARRAFLRKFRLTVPHVAGGLHAAAR
ncbi:MAG: ABC transporter permease [Propylenella sp.]